MGVCFDVYVFLQRNMLMTLGGKVESVSQTCDFFSNSLTMLMIDML